MNKNHKLNHTIKVLSDFETMLRSFPLIQQLNPKMSMARYTSLLRAIVDQGNYFQIGCFDGDRQIGLSGIWIGTKVWCGKYLEVDNFIVDEKYRGQGIGKKLLEWADQRAREENCEMIALDSYVVAEGAHRFYFTNGFKIEGFHMTKRL